MAVHFYLTCFFSLLFFFFFFAPREAVQDKLVHCENRFHFPISWHGE